MFRLENIKFKDILTIDGLEIKANRITCIVGPSGAGKSTLLKLLNNLISPDRGTIYYQGVDIEEKDPVKLRKEIMMLGQQTVIFPGSIRDNLEEIFKLIGDKIPVVDNLKEVLEFVKLDKELTDGAQLLSGGEQQRIALARLLLLHPEVLLLDEPSSDLDDETELLIIKSLVKYVEGAAKTMVMVTHSKEIARQYGDDIITIVDGQVEKLTRGEN